MANVLGAYNPTFFANEALIQLEKALGLAGRIHRGFERERNSYELGDTIRIKKPGTFTAQDAPSTAQDVKTTYKDITLDRWKEVKFSLTDKELAYTGERIITDHIRPAAYALADELDQYLATIGHRGSPWYYDLNATPGSVVADITGPRKVLFDNGVPMGDESMMHYMVDSTMEMGLLGLSAFTQHQGAGQQGVEAQNRGYIGKKYGFNFFANQNVQSHTSGTINDTALLVNNASGYAAGSTTMNLDAADAGVTGTLVAGDSFSIAGQTQRYVVTGTFTAASNAFTAVTFLPGLAAAVVDDQAVTVRKDSHVGNLAFHRNYMALALAPLPTLGDGAGARIATASDPITGLSLRSRIYYDGDNSKLFVALDMLYGAIVLDPNLACVASG